MPSITELICDLDLAGQLVGRTGFCIHPRAVLKRVPKVGGTKDVNLEKLRALAPTHVIVNVDENEKPVAEALAGFVPNLIVTHPLGPRDNLALYRLLGGIFGREREAEALCLRFERAYARAMAAVRAFAPRRVLYLIWKKPWMTIARDTYVSRMLRLVNWRTLPGRAGERYPEIALESAWVKQAEVILLSSEPYPFRHGDAAELRATSALRGKRVALIDGAMTSWYGSRAIRALDYLPRFRARLERGPP